jgi:hypothetical protein
MEVEDHVEQAAHVDQEAPEEDGGEEKEGVGQGDTSSRSTTG